MVVQKIHCNRTWAAPKYCQNWRRFIIATVIYLSAIVSCLTVWLADKVDKENMCTAQHVLRYPGTHLNKQSSHLAHVWFWYDVKFISMFTICIRFVCVSSFLFLFNLWVAVVGTSMSMALLSSAFIWLCVAGFGLGHTVFQLDAVVSNQTIKIMFLNAIFGLSYFF